MKHLLITLMLMLTISFAKAQSTDKPAKELARVEMYQGYYIFIEAKPIREYEYLGTVKAGMTWNGYLDEILASILKKVKNDYPRAEGLIIRGTEADAIIFK